MIPNQGGIRKPLLYFLKKSYWFGIQPKESPENIETDDSYIALKDDNDDFASSEENKQNFEEVSEKLKAQTYKNQTLEIKNLSKTYSDGHQAVDNLNLTLYTSQIFALLGENGAGKTTTISMLTGLLSQTSGTASLFGIDLFKERELAEKHIGLCPQHDILFDKLSVYEHLEVFGTFKSMKGEEIKAQAEVLLKEFHLWDKLNAEVHTLSGGMKRKLSICIAFLGNHTKFVMLDEPTSGLDMTARRDLWASLQAYNKDKILLLTTHYMDEADFLGDRIAIMSFGNLKCCGSSLFLKKRFGIGYNLTIAKKHGADSERISEFVFQQIPDAELQCDVGTEIIIRLPFQASQYYFGFLLNLF